MELNPKLFENNMLKPDVLEALRRIAEEFLNSINNDIEKDIIPADIRLVGSNAGFDFNDDSDIDLHIVVNFDHYSCDPPLLQAALNIERINWNSQYNITVKQLPVELYVEDIKSSTNSNGIYSVSQNRWIKFPEDEIASSEYFKNADIIDYSDKWITLIELAINNTDKYSLDYCQRLLDRIYMMRKNGIETYGRLSKGNIIFKLVRARGYLDKLKEHIKDLQSMQLTLEQRKAGN